MRRSRTALYGGAFDPFHNGHLVTVAALLNSGCVQQVMVVPSGARPDKVTQTPCQHRWEMVQRGVHESFAGDPRVVVSDLHISAAVGYGTVDLLVHLSSDRATEFLVVIGEELVPELPQWRESERLRAAATFLVLPRPGAQSAAALPGWRLERLHLPHPVSVQVSSTILREMLAQDLCVAGLMPASVVAYCRQHAVYAAGARSA